MAGIMKRAEYVDDKYDAVFKLYKTQGVPEPFVGLWAAIYKIATASVKLFSGTDRFNIGI